jgi:NTP pyrophosphatase (non-canonical NTP hydrolase)
MLNIYAAICRKANDKWLRNPQTGVERNKDELLTLIASKISKAIEGERKDLMDDKLPHRRMVEVELADALICIFAYAGANGLDLNGAFQEKIQHHRKRP